MKLNPRAKEIYRSDTSIFNGRFIKYVTLAGVIVVLLIAFFDAIMR